ncbi:right-handed parallel beta-helix repeat-containing protein [Vibrio cholerae]|uniref:right-handed parallel beta-helix repeat-containing protein n=1 Tax=Vibrio cholerae TaxID=666 RepID=UPI0021AEB7DB|nr:right-handed parallel beta-helix repeat-containing protein [Vibrio cholerae]
MSSPSMEALVKTIDALEKSTAELVDLYTQALFGVDSSAHVLSSNVNAKALQVAENALTTTAKAREAALSAHIATEQASRSALHADRSEAATQIAVIHVSHLKALPTYELTDGKQFSVAGFYAESYAGGGLFVFDSERDFSEHNGAEVIALDALKAWDGEEQTVNTFLSWSGVGQGCFVQIGTQTLYASQFVTDPNDPVSVYRGLDRLNKQVTHGSIIYLDRPMVAPSSALIIDKNQVKVIGGALTRTSGATEYPFWVGRADTQVDGVTFIGLSLTGEREDSNPQWGKQGVYIRRATNTAFIGCQFKKVGDAAIRLAASLSSHTVEGALESRTDGVQLIGCVFEDCTQVTTNNTGAQSVIFSGCVLRRIGSVKFTQRNLVKGKPSLLIGCLFDDVSKIVEVQGGGNVEIVNCSGTAEMLIAAYPNASTFVTGQPIPYGNIQIRGGSFVLSCPSGNACYLETLDSPSGERVVNYGSVAILGAKLTSLNPQARLLRAHANPSVTASMHPNIRVDGCQLSNFLGDGLVSVSHSVVDEWSLEIANNQWDEVNRVLVAELSSGGAWSIDLSNNRGKVRLGTHSIARAALGRLLKVHRNRLECSSNEGNSFAFFDMAFFAFALELTENELDVSQYWRPVCASFAQPSTSGCTLKMGGNKLYLPALGAEGTLPRPVYVSAGTGIGWQGVLQCYPSYVFGEGRKLRAETASGLSFSVIEFEYLWVGKESSRRLLKRVFAENIAGVSGAWRVVEVYSDGVVRSHGRHQNQTSNDFNLYFPFSGSTLLAEPFAPQIIPEEPCLPYFVQPISNGLVVRFMNLAGQGVSPWFRYSVEYKVSLNELANWTGGS